MKRMESLRRLRQFLIYTVIAMLGMVGTTAAQENTTISEQNFESAEGISTWPGGTRVVLDDQDPKSGSSSIYFNQDNNYSAYWYIDVKPGYEYDLSLAIRSTGKPLERNGIKINFNKEGEGNGSAGSETMSFGDILADGQWHEFEGGFVVPADAVRIQVILDLFRTQAQVHIDDVVIREIGPVEPGSEPAGQKASSASEGSTDEGTAPFENGDFSDGTTGWTPWFKPEQATYALDTDYKHSGDASMRITGPDDRHILAQKIAVEPGAVYKITFWASTKGDKVGNSAVTLDFYPTNAVPRPYLGLQQMTGDKPWEEFTFYAEAPADAEGAYLCLIHNSGTVWFDDIRVEEDQ